MKCAGTLHSAKQINRHPVGTKRINRQGYVEIKTSSSTWKLEHRIVVETNLRRSLSGCERVHHKNGNRQDNKLENLELWTLDHHSKKDPPGVRTTDIMFEYLAQIKSWNLAQEAITFLQNSS